MKHWGKWRKEQTAKSMIPDGNGDLVQALGLTLDGSGAGLGQRSQRFYDGDRIMVG